MAPPRRYSDSERDRAVQMVHEMTQAPGSKADALKAVAQEFKVSVGTLRLWLRRRGSDAPHRPTERTEDQVTDGGGPEREEKDRKPQGKKFAIDMAALVVSVVALIASVGSLMVADRSEDRQRQREEQEYARGVVLSIVERVLPAAPGNKPEIVGSTVTVANYGPFAVEDVTLEAYEETISMGVQLRLVNTTALGNLGPCQIATLNIDRPRDRVTFVDANGQKWTRREASPPERGLREPDAPREVHDMRSPQAPIEISRLSPCG